MFDMPEITMPSASTASSGPSRGSLKYARDRRCGNDEQRNDHALEQADGPGRVEIVPVRVRILDQRAVDAEGEPRLDQPDHQGRHRHQAEIGRTENAREDGDIRDTDQTHQPAQCNGPDGALDDGGAQPRRHAAFHAAALRRLGNGALQRCRQLGGSLAPRSASDLRWIGE